MRRGPLPATDADERLVAARREIAAHCQGRPSCGAGGRCANSSRRRSQRRGAQRRAAQRGSSLSEHRGTVANDGGRQRLVCVGRQRKLLQHPPVTRGGRGCAASCSNRRLRGARASGASAASVCEWCGSCCTCGRRGCRLRAARAAARASAAEAAGRQQHVHGRREVIGGGERISAGSEGCCSRCDRCSSC